MLPVERNPSPILAARFERRLDAQDAAQFTVRARLRRHRNAVHAGERDQPFGEFVNHRIGALHRFLRLERPTDEERAAGQADPPGMIHLPDWADSEWLKQLVAEQLVTVRNKRGYARQEWQKLRERNEALDTRVYARAAAWIMGADRWDEATWRRLEAQAGVATRPAVGPTAGDGAVAEPTTQATPKAGTPTTPRRKRRAYTPNFMRD